MNDELDDAIRYDTRYTKISALVDKSFFGITSEGYDLRYLGSVVDMSAETMELAYVSEGRMGIASFCASMIA